MRTHKNITNKLERRILAAALNILRTIKEWNFKASTLVFLSSIDCGVFDTVYVDVATRKIIKIEYDKYVGKKIKKFTITL